MKLHTDEVLRCARSAAVVYDNFLLFVDGPQGKLFQMALTGSTVLELPVSSKPQNPVAVDFDPVTQSVYWTDIESRTVRRATLNGSNQEIFLQLQQGDTVQPFPVSSACKKSANLAE